MKNKNLNKEILGNIYYQRGHDYYDKEDYQNAKKQFFKALKLGNFDAAPALAHVYSATAKNKNDYLFSCFLDTDALTSKSLKYWDKFTLINNIAADCEKLKNFKSSFDYHEEAFFNNDKEYGMYNFAHHLKFGNVCKKNYKLAFKLFIIFANQRNSSFYYAAAVGELGHMYMEGLGTKKDEKKGFLLINKSGQLGYIPALYYLGYLYFTGKYTKKNSKTAFRYYKKAYLLGDKKYSPASIAKCYEKGIGVKKDINAAIKYYKVAIENGNDKCRHKYERLINNYGGKSYAVHKWE